MKRLTLLSVSIVLPTNLIYSQSVEIKDSADETLMIINDEGDAKSSITISQSKTAPVLTKDKLYNDNGTLKWDGNTLATGTGDGHSLDASDGSPTDAVYVNAVGHVGIGTTTPSSKLHIKSSTADLTGSLHLETSLGTAEDWYIYMDANDDLRFRNDGTETLILQKNSGNIGIGTTNPSASLQVNGNTKIGVNTNVVSITDIIELNGTTPSSGSFESVSYPSGFTKNNTRVITYEVLYNNLIWTSNTTFYDLATDILIYFENSPNYHNVPFRLILLKTG